MFFDHGLWYINDIVGKNGKLMSFNQFTEACDMICSLHSYNQLIAALRRDWKKDKQWDD